MKTLQQLLSELGEANAEVARLTPGYDAAQARVRQAADAVAAFDAVESKPALNAGELAECRKTADVFLRRAYAENWFPMKHVSRFCEKGDTYARDYVVKNSPKVLPADFCYHVAAFAQVRGLKNLWEECRP